MQYSGRAVTDADIVAAHILGATDLEIHATVLIAILVMFNRFVDGLGATTPDDPAFYELVATQPAAEGYMTKSVFDGPVIVMHWWALRNVVALSILMLTLLHAPPIPSLTLLMASPAVEMKSRNRRERAAGCVLALVLLATALATPLRGQAKPRAVARSKPYLYVAKAVGEWVVAGDSGNRTLRPLAHVAPGTRVAVRFPERVDTTHALVLRDPVSLRVATVQCKPVVVCLGPHAVDRLSFTDPSWPIATRTGALFASLGERKGTREAVRQVGARGAPIDWGALVIGSETDVVELDVVTARLGADRSGLSARICPLHPVDDSCEVGRGTPARRCRLDAPKACSITVTRPTAVSIAIVSTGDDVGEQPIATALAVMAPRGSLARVEMALARFTRDLQQIRAQLSDDEYGGLLRAALLDVVRLDTRD